MEYLLHRSKRKTLTVKVEDDGKIVVLAPLRMPTVQIERFLDQNKHRIETLITRVRARRRYVPDSLGEDEIALLCERARAEFLPIVARYAEILRVHPEKITITKAEKRFGSCSSRGHICLSYRLIFYPPDAVEYVIVHELCHLIELNHSAKFYRLVESILPDPKRRESILKGE